MLPPPPPFQFVSNSTYGGDSSKVNDMQFANSLLQRHNELNSVDPFILLKQMMESSSLMNLKSSDEDNKLSDPRFIGYQNFSAGIKS